MKTSPKAGDKKSVLGLATENFLAPLPLPTGRKPNNTMGMVWRINDTYMDVSDCTPGAVVATVHFTLVCTLLILWWIIYYMGGVDIFMNFGGLLLISVFVFLPIIVIIVSVYAKPRQPLRFNRQRREVCVPATRGGDYWYVPWETVKASVEGVNTVSQGGVNRNGSLIIGFSNPNFKGEVKLASNGFSNNEHAERQLYFPNVVPEVGAGMWELIRTYMEEGPDKINVDTDLFHVRNDTILKQYIEAVKESIAKHGLAKGLLEGIFGLFLLNILLVYYIERKHLSPPPDLLGDEVEAWSQPLPQEQWAKRSPELEQALREYEAKQEQKSVA